MRNIFIDFQKIKNRHSGLGQFCYHLGKALAQENQASVKVTAFVPKDKFNFFGEKFSYILSKAYHPFFPPNANSFDVWHGTHQGADYLPRSKKCKVILTIHDLNFLQKYKGVKQQIKRYQLQQKVNRADSIVCISHFTEMILRQHIKIGNQKVSVIYNGNNMQPNIVSQKPKQLNSERFIFSIGIVQPKKNLHVLLPLLLANKELSLVIAGNTQHTYTNEILQKATALGVQNRVLFLGEISEAEKQWCYQNCEAFVFPSLAEGFGMPVVEAMSFGKPIFLSNQASLPEIGGEVSFYWNDFDAESMCQVFENGMLQYNSQPDLKEKIIHRSSLFSWEKAAQEYLKLYRTI